MNIIELFKTITNIPRCSGYYYFFEEFIKKFAASYNYEIQIDKFHNILCYKKQRNSKLCLQAHYDIVCLEKGKMPQIIEKDGYLMALDSTLGADNGIGCAYMLKLMQENYNLEFLFTSDEEIGLIGASNIQLDIISKYMLNLDSEQEDVVCIGCAGGIDIFGVNSISKYVPNENNKTLYEITIDNLEGGHSGVDIDKNIQNALKLLIDVIKQCDGELLDLNGGERINSIPKSAKAIIVSNKTPQSNHKNINITKIDTQTNHYKQLDKNIIEFIYNFSNGVLEYNDELKCVHSSINLAIVTNTLDGVKIEISARSMDEYDLTKIKENTIKLLKNHNFSVTTNGKYSPWKPEQNEFVNLVKDVHNRYQSDAKLEAIHAGLECAILKKKYPFIQPCSIGPNIYYPHSNREKCEIKSIQKVYKIIKQICDTV